jgi:UDP-GlcNAc3NAcA epimerase
MKIFPVWKEMGSRYPQVKKVLVHTGQHYDELMSGIFFREFSMPAPDFFLGVGSGPHGAQTAKVMVGLEELFLSKRPDILVVVGDVNSTLAGALVAAKMEIKLVHVESGLRSFDRTMPEEINRILTDRISSWLFAPTTVAAQHLMTEGIGSEKIHLVGDVMYDVALYHGARVSAEAGILKQLNLKPGSYVLATVHRAENTDNLERLTAIVDALVAIAESIRVVWPLHPRTRAVLLHTGRLERLSGKVTLIEPVGYLDMVQLEKYTALIATDSGGVQKEAFFYGVPCVTLRDETEWVELVESGWNRLAPPVDAQSLVRLIKAALGSRGEPVAPYGTGSAAQAIVDKLSELS